MRQLSDIIKKQVIELLEKGLSERQIAKKVGISNFSVNKIRNESKNQIPMAKHGRVSKLSSRDRLFCVRQVTLNCKSNAVEVKKALEYELGKQVSASTVRRSLEISGFGPVVKQKKPLLRSKNIKDRLRWAQAHKYWTLDDWKRVIWSDETKINRFGSDGLRYAWKRDGESVQKQHVQQTVKHGGGSIMIWGCITYDGPGYLAKIDSTLDKELYQAILEEDLNATIDWYKYKNEKVIFQHDNDPKHTAVSVSSYLKQQPYQVLDWPAQSPDLNPIENIWSRLNYKLFHNYDRPPRGMNELWERIQEQWNKISKEECRNVINSMPKRCKDVIKAKGYWTNY